MTYFFRGGYTFVTACDKGGGGSKKTKNRVTYFMDSPLGGGSITSANNRAWFRVFSIQVMAFVNWKVVATKKHQKKGLKDSIITKAVFGKYI